MFAFVICMIFMNVLVTGGAGFIGSHLCELLIKKGYGVTVFDNFSSGNEKNLFRVINRINLIHGDICNRPDVEAATKGIDYVVHLAAMISVQESISDPYKCHLINVEGTKNILDAAVLNKVKKVIIASSAAVYGNAKPPLKETDCCAPISPYGESKLLAEKLAIEYYQKFDLPTVSLRFFNVYGPRQNANSSYAGVILKFISALSENKSPIIFGDGEQTRDFIYVEDVVAAILLAMENKRAHGEIFNVATGIPTSINSLFRTVALIMRKNIKPSYQPALTGDIRHSFADIKKISTLLGFKPSYTLKKGLKKTIDFYLGQ
jgi:UDP-glucose 4-epimerase